LYELQYQQQQDNQAQTNTENSASALVKAASVANQNRVTADALANQNRVGAASVANQNKVAANELANQNRVGAASVANQNQVAANELANRNEQVSRQNVVELVNTADPKDRLTVYERDGKYYDPKTDQQVDSAGYKAVQKSTGRGASFSRFAFPKMRDAYGNEVIARVDKGSGTMEPFAFPDGTTYDPDKAKALGEISAKQGGLEVTEKERAKQQQNRIADITANAGANADSLKAIDQAISSLENGADSGPFQSRFPEFLKNAAEINLANAKEKLGLAQLGKHTMGSLSEKEGEWLRNSEIPNHDEDDLLDYMKRRKQAMLQVLEASMYEKEALESGEQIDLELLNDILTGGDPMSIKKPEY
jgi:hypothetical protein